MSTVRLKYVGELGAFTQPDINVSDQKRGEPFVAPKDWADERIKLEPNRWEKVGGGDEPSRPPRPTAKPAKPDTDGGDE